MLRTYQTKIPLPFDESYELVKEAAAHIHAWKLTSFDPKTSFIEWKQQFWSLTGSAVISARFKQKRNAYTRVTIAVYKPLQVVDPFRICDRIFSKLENAVEQKLAEIAGKKQEEKVSS
ncbi:MAG: hypothetical protein CSA26_05005 [Desulfobacterales bacterium]|nr:MAG: hypothetical protein CSA26_05005 [Desulfobacterales bacterium]